MGDVQEKERETRLKVRAEMKRASVVKHIRSVHDMALCVSAEPGLGPEFLVSARDLDSLWLQFKSEDDALLDYLVTLGDHDQYVEGLSAEVRGLIVVSKAVAERLTPTCAEVIDLSYLRDNTLLPTHSAVNH
jgi:hypothetical protein